MADDVRPWTCSSVGAPTGNQPAQKQVARSGGLTTNVNNNATKPPKNTNKNQNFLLTNQKRQR